MNNILFSEISTVIVKNWLYCLYSGMFQDKIKLFLFLIWRILTARYSKVHRYFMLHNYLIIIIWPNQIPLILRKPPRWSSAGFADLRKHYRQLTRQDNFKFGFNKRFEITPKSQRCVPSIWMIDALIRDRGRQTIGSHAAVTSHRDQLKKEGHNIVKKEYLFRRYNPIVLPIEVIVLLTWSYHQ